MYKSYAIPSEKAPEQSLPLSVADIAHASELEELDLALCDRGTHAETKPSNSPAVYGSADPSAR